MYFTVYMLKIHHSNKESQLIINNYEINIKIKNKYVNNCVLRSHLYKEKMSGFH